MILYFVKYPVIRFFSAVLFPIGSRQSWRSSKTAIVSLPFGESYNLETNHTRIGNFANYQL